MRHTIHTYVVLTLFEGDHIFPLMTPFSCSFLLCISCYLECGIQGQNKGNRHGKHLSRNSMLGGLELGCSLVQILPKPH